MRILLLTLLISLNSYSQTPGSGVTDIDGNQYSTVIIGTQQWMSENLKTSKYNNGDLIPYITDNNLWSNATQGAFCYHSNNSSLNNEYGKLYNWFTVADSRNVCPVGWRVPSDQDWVILSDLLGGHLVAGGAVRTTGTLQNNDGLWQAPNTGATNSSGFNGKPGGLRYLDGDFYYFNEYAYWWSIDSYDTDLGWNRNTNYTNTIFDWDWDDKNYGLSIRCIRSQTNNLENIKIEGRKILRITDLLGRDTNPVSNTLLIYYYSDGSSEKVFNLE